jgi:hypothetical protein
MLPWPIKVANFVRPTSQWVSPTIGRGASISREFRRRGELMIILLLHPQRTERAIALQLGDQNPQGRRYSS